MTPAAQRIHGCAGEWSQPGNTQPNATMFKPIIITIPATPATNNTNSSKLTFTPSKFKTMAQVSALLAATIGAATSAAAATDDKPKVVITPILVEPACAPGECSGK